MSHVPPGQVPPEPPEPPDPSDHPTEAEPAIVYLDVDDEITSAAARLRRLEASRIVLVLPYGSRLATSRINFRLLAREADARGKRLEVVAADASARALAATAGLAVHASVAALEGREAPGSSATAGPGATAGPASQPGSSGANEYPVAPVVPSRTGDGTETRVLTIPRSAEPVPVVGRTRPPIRPRVLLTALLAVALLVGVGGFAALQYLPSATIVVTPATQSIGPLELSVEARTDVASPDPVNLVVPAREFSFDLEASQTFTTTGAIVSETKATGSVTFQNCDTGGNVSIPSGSRVATKAGIGFRTLAKVTIRRARIFPFACYTGSVAVEAEVAGLSGNVAAGTITKVPPGYDPIVLTVTNGDPTSGGTHEETPQVSQSDIDAALAALQAALGEDLDAKVAAADGVPAGTTLLAPTARVGESQPSVDPATLLGQDVATFDLGATATGTVVGVDPGPVRAIAEARLSKRVTEGWQLVAGSTSIDVGAPRVVGESIVIDVTASARQVRAVDHDALVEQIRGRDVPAARALLDDYGTVDIQLWPDWVTTIPDDVNRISLTIDTGGPVASPTPATSPAGP